MQDKSSAKRGQREKKITRKSQGEENESTMSSSRDNSPVRIEEFEESSKESEQEPTKSKKVPEPTGLTITRSGIVSKPVTKQ